MLEAQHLEFVAHHDGIVVPLGVGVGGGGGERGLGGWGAGEGRVGSSGAQGARGPKGEVGPGHEAIPSPCKAFNLLANKPLLRPPSAPAPGARAPLATRGALRLPPAPPSLCARARAISHLSGCLPWARSAADLASWMDESCGVGGREREGRGGAPGAGMR
jgi:hypothetical protein